jgi:tetratricopeptide (TPR) repeat protein
VTFSAPPPELEVARTMYRQREWGALAERLRPLGEETLTADPELGFLFADAARRLGETETSRRVAERVEPAAMRTGDRRLAVNVVNLRGMALTDGGRLEEAEDAFARLLELASDWQDEEFAARASNNLGVLANMRGRRDAALTCYARALAAYQRLGYVRGLAQTHHNLGISYRDLAFDADADAHFARAIELGDAAGAEDVIAGAELERALLRSRAGDGPLAESMARRALDRYQRLGDPLGEGDAMRGVAAALRASGRDAEAGDLLDAALVLAESHEDPLLLAEVQRDRGLLLRDAGRSADAREALLKSAESFGRMGAAAEAEAVRGIAGSLGD